MKIERVVVGELDTNCYILTQDNKCLVVDPGAEYAKINEHLIGKEVLGILLTHHHFDHVGALKEILENYNTKVYDFNNLKEQNYIIGPFSFSVIYNPGHTDDSISFYFKEDKVMFVGDFVFLNSIGRCDLDGGSFIKMKDSISKLIKMEDDITLYPGHGLKTTLNYEKKHNSFF